MSSAALARLQEERKMWRKDHPPGFIAKPQTRADGSTDMLTWNCKIPGKEGTICEGAVFPVTLRFTPDHPNKPPTGFMPKGFFHVNVFDNGGICLSTLKETVPDHLHPEYVNGWRPNMTVKTILMSIQELLCNPNFGSVANPQVANLYHRDRKGYEKRLKAQTAQYTGKDDDDE